MSCTMNGYPSAIIRAIEFALDRENSIGEKRVDSKEELFLDDTTKRFTKLTIAPSRAFPAIFSARIPINLSRQEKDLAVRVAILAESNAKVSCGLRLCEPTIESLADSQVIAFFASRVFASSVLAKL